MLSYWYYVRKEMTLFFTKAIWPELSKFGVGTFVWKYFPEAYFVFEKDPALSFNAFYGTLLYITVLALTLLWVVIKLLFAVLSWLLCKAKTTSMSADRPKQE
jgi:hypothetical protein